VTCSAPCSSLELLDQTAFTELASEWSDLLERSYDNRLFLTPKWHQIWWEHFGVGTAQIFALKNEDGLLQAVLPLQVSQRDGERVLTLVGDPNVSDYMDALAERSEAQNLLTQLWTEAFSRLEWDRIELRHVPSRSPVAPAAQAAASERGAAVEVADDEVCPVAILCKDWEGYLQMLSKKQRHELRRKLRRSQEGAEWDWRTVKTQEELDRDLPIFFRLHEASARDKARFMTPDMRAYFKVLSSSLLEDGILRLSTFTRDGVDVASTMAFLYRERYLLYNSGYLPHYAAQNPGIAAVAFAMQDAIAEGAVAFDFLSGDEPYKYQFGASNTYTCQVRSVAQSS
jgi:CelD/BcsL family acetyltransferase involved in cellulose biosynthesis